jgi:hypothetical protein
MNLTQFEWIESGLKCKSYHCVKLVCNSRVLNYEIAIFFLTSSSSSHPWKREERKGRGLCRGGRVGPAGRARGARPPPPGRGAWGAATAAGKGRVGRGHCRRRGARGRGSTAVAAGHRHCRRRGGGRGAAGRGNGGGRGAEAGEGEGRVREALHGRENKEHEETVGTTMKVSHRGRRLSPEPRTNPSIAGDSGVRSTNRTRPDEALDETNAAVSSDSADDARIGCNCSPELEPLRTSVSNTGS